MTAGRRLPLLGLALVVMVGCGRPPDEPPSPSVRAEPAATTVWFDDATAATGLDFVHFNGMSGDRSIIEEMGSGGALFDADGDGDLDLYLVQGAMLATEHGKTLADATFPTRHASPPSDRLYRNDLDGDGDVRWTDVTDASGLAAIAVGYGLGVATGDYDRDGDIDLYVTNHGANQLLRNEGPDTAGVPRFRDVAREAGVDVAGLSVPAAFADLDGDGWLDLYVGNYVEVPAEMPVCHNTLGAVDYCGPDSFRAESDRLFRNRGRGADGHVTFEDVSRSSGLDTVTGPALGIVVADLNGDGRLDLYVANDGQANRMWGNRSSPGRLVLEDQALLAGNAVNAQGLAESSMGVEAADLDGDGALDLFMTHLATESNTLFRGDGRGGFQDVTARTGLGPPSRVFTAFGVVALDADLDGHLDLLVTNGAVNELEALVRAGDPYPLHEPNQLFRNLGDEAGSTARFVEISDVAGPVFSRSEVGRGLVSGDLDEDGDVDVVLVNNNGPARVLLNRRADGRPWVGIDARTGDPSMAALGAVVALRRDGEVGQHRLVRAAGSYVSAHDPRVVLALGDEPRLDGVRITWPGGEVEDFPAVAGRYQRVIEGRGTAVARPDRGRPAW